MSEGWHRRILVDRRRHQQPHNTKPRNPSIWVFGSITDYLIRHFSFFVCFLFYSYLPDNGKYSIRRILWCHYADDDAFANSPVIFVEPSANVPNVFLWFPCHWILVAVMERCTMRSLRLLESFFFNLPSGNPVLYPVSRCLGCQLVDGWLTGCSPWFLLRQRFPSLMIAHWKRSNKNVGITEYIVCLQGFSAGIVTFVTVVK